MTAELEQELRYARSAIWTVAQMGGESAKLLMQYIGWFAPEGGKLSFAEIAAHLAAAHPELVAREAEAGHEVAIHNWAHTDVYGVEVGELRDSVDRTIAAIEDAGASAPRLWRPPYGRVDAPALMVAAERGLDVLLWSEHTPTAQAAADAAGAAHAGSVILCHDGRSQPSEELLRTLGESIAALQARGLAFVTGSRMLEGAAGGIGTVIEP